MMENDDNGFTHSLKGNLHATVHLASDFVANGSLS
jgi:hypothetical protein